MLSFPYYFSSHVYIFVEFYVECLCRVFCRPFWRLLGYFFADLFAAFFVAFFVHFFGGFLPTFFRGFFAEFLYFSTLISTISGLLSYDFWGVLFRVCRFERASSVSSEASQNGVFVILQLYSFSIPGLVKALDFQTISPQCKWTLGLVDAMTSSKATVSSRAWLYRWFSCFSCYFIKSPFS